MASLTFVYAGRISGLRHNGHTDDLYTTTWTALHIDGFEDQLGFCVPNLPWDTLELKFKVGRCLRQTFPVHPFQYGFVFTSYAQLCPPPVSKIHGCRSDDTTTKSIINQRCSGKKLLMNHCVREYGVCYGQFMTRTEVQYQSTIQVQIR